MNTHQNFTQDSSQDSLDNIIVEEDEVNRFEEADLQISMGPFYEGMEGENDDQEEDDAIPNRSFDEVSHIDDDHMLATTYPHTLQLSIDEVILKKISEKKATIFECVSRKEFERKYSSNAQRNLSRFSQSSSQNKQNGIFSDANARREMPNYSRREKSLEELSKKFLSLFLDKEESLLSLDKITNQLGVERRRIYDIINILESLQLVSRRGKNNYKWNGFQKIYLTISQYSEQGGRRSDEMEYVEDEDEWCEEASAEENQKREKSLEMLSIGFLKLFLHWRNTMTLEAAARKLSSKTIDDHKIKTKIRRLYDIANVFKSLGLIRKTSLSDTKKPAFEWIGVSGLDCFAHKVIGERKNTSSEYIQSNLAAASEEDMHILKEQNFEMNNNAPVQLLPFFQRAASTGMVEEEITEKRLNKKTVKQPQLRKSFILQQQMKEQQAKSSSSGCQQQKPILQQPSKLSDDQVNAIQSLLASQQAQTGGLWNIDNQQLLNGLMAKCVSKILSNLVSKSLFELNPFDNSNTDASQQNILLPLLSSLLSTSSLPATNYQENLHKPVEQRINIQNQFHQECDKENLGRQSLVLGGSKGSQTKGSSAHFPHIQPCRQLNMTSNVQNFIGSASEMTPTTKASFESFSTENVTSSTLLRTPLLKRTLTIIPPRADERACMPTPPTCKRSYSANLQPSKLFGDNFGASARQQTTDSFHLLFSDKTNIQERAGSSASSIREQQINKQLSSFKKIRKLTYDACEGSFEADRQTNSAFELIAASILTPAVQYQN